MEIYVKNKEVNMPEVTKGLRDTEYAFVASSSYGDWVCVNKKTGKISIIGFKAVIDNWSKRGLIEMREGNNEDRAIQPNN